MTTQRLQPGYDLGPTQTASNTSSITVEIESKIMLAVSET